MQGGKSAPSPSPSPATATDDDVRKAVAEKPVVVVGRRGCCMAHVARRLLLGQGANPAVLEVADDDADPAALAVVVPASAATIRPRDKATAVVHDGAVGAGAAVFPAVFIGGRLVGGLDRLMAMHIAGELVPVLKQAGALWL